MSKRSRLGAALVAAAMIWTVPLSARAVRDTLASAGNYTPAKGCVLPVPAGSPSTCTWQGIVLQSPQTESAIATPDLTQPCHPTTLAECEDTKVAVPSRVSPSSLYVKISWQHPNWSAYLYLIDPTGKLHGRGGIGCDTSSYEKGCGNQTTLPFDEVVVADPMPGVWTVRVAAVNVHDETYTGQVALTNSHPLEWARESLAQLTSHLTRSDPVNIVFAGWRPTPAELQELKAGLTSELVPSVSEKQFCDGGAGNDQAGSGLIQHETAHCTATAAPSDSNYIPTGAVPYFEPVRYLFNYQFLAADQVWTRDLFAAMKAATTQDHTLSPGRVPATAETGPFKAAYLAAYNATDGTYRGPSSQVTDTTKVDEIDGLTVEDWVQGHRMDGKYYRSFLDLSTGVLQSGAFIDPDPSATHDPYWNSNGAGPVNLDRDPQGVNSGVTFFLLDTFSPSYASDYFRTDHYHYWWTADHVQDPDLHVPDYSDNGRGWGGRYRFHLLDLGAAPSTYERADWVSASVAPDGGSAAFDPPIWDYRHSAQWNGSQSPGPLQAGGNTLGQVMGWEITQGLAFKYVGGYLYRPIPNDVYVVAINNLVDHYSLPSEGDLYVVDLDKIAQKSVALQALSSAAPYASVLPGPDQTRILGCAANRAAVVGNPTQVGVLTQGLVKEVPNPRCTTKPDGMQQAIEDAKANGSGELLPVTGAPNLPTYAVNQNYLRDYIDHHRSQYAPLYNGAFTVPVVNLMFEHEYNVALPLLVGGIAENTNGGEGWGQFDNVNDSLVPSQAIDCTLSSPVAPGCNGTPDVFRHDYGLTYVMEHEAAHFLGVNHPHDGANTVEKSTDGQWHYYYSMLKWLYDFSASPTTYAGSYGTYEIVDQERLMVGHAAEYLKQAEDWVADDWFQEGAAGHTTASPAVAARQKRAAADIAQATSLFRAGDYLHAMYAMRNAALHAKGVVQAPVAPHRLTTDEAAHDRNAIFAIHPQPAYGSGARPATFPAQWVGTGKPAASNGSSPIITVKHAAHAVVTYFCHIHWG